MKSLSNYHLSTKETQLPSLASSSPGAIARSCGIPLSNTSVLVLEAFSRKLKAEVANILPRGIRIHAVKDFQQVIQEVVYNAKGSAESYRFLWLTTR
jgi:hypothetical protein